MTKLRRKKIILFYCFQSITDESPSRSLTRAGTAEHKAEAMKARCSPTCSYALFSCPSQITSAHLPRDGTAHIG